MQDDAIQKRFLAPWQATLTNSIAVAMKARQSVATSRLELDAAKQTFKTAGPAKQEQARLEVENAEDDLVQKIEVAITLMKTVLEKVSAKYILSEADILISLSQPEPLQNLNELVKAQLSFFSTAAESLNAIQGDIEELSVAAEGEYRYIKQ